MPANRTSRSGPRSLIPGNRVNNTVSALEASARTVANRGVRNPHPLGRSRHAHHRNGIKTEKMSGA